MNKIKNGISSIMMLGTLLLAPCASAADGVEVNHLGVNNTLVRITGEGNYLLLPVQESNDDAKVVVLVDGKVDKTINVRLAKKQSRLLRPF